MFISRRRRSMEDGASGSASAFSVTTTVPRNPSDPNRVTFTAGVTDATPKYVLNTLSQSLTTGSTAYATLAGVPTDLVNVMQWNAGAVRLMVGRAGGVSKNDVTIYNVDFRNQPAGQGFGFWIYGANTKFVNCLFDLSDLPFVNTNFIVVQTAIVGGRYPCLEAENCFFDGLNSSWFIREFIQGSIGVFRYNYLTRIPADLMLGPTTQDGVTTSIEYNYFSQSLTACDGCTQIIGTGTGVTWSTASDSVTLGSDFTVTTNGTGGATKTIVAGTYTIQQIIDAINGGTFGTSGTATTYTDGQEAYIYAPGRLAIMAYAKVTGPNASATRTITLGGSVGTLMGTGTTTSQSTLNWYARGQAYPYGRHAIPHADTIQTSGSYAGAGPLYIRWNYFELIPQLSDGQASAYPNDPIAPNTIYNYAGPTGDIFIAVDLSDMYCDTFVQYNDFNGYVGAFAIQNQSKANKWTAAAPTNGKWRGLMRMTDCYFKYVGGGYYRSLSSMNFQSSTNSNWATPAAWNTGGTNGDTITFWDGPSGAAGANSVQIVCSGSNWNAGALADAINAANAAGTFRLEAYVTGSGATSRLNIGSTRFVPSLVGNENKVRGNWLEIEATGTGSAALTTFGMSTGVKTGAQDFINPYSFERLYDYDTPATQISPVLNGLPYASYNALPSAPSPTVTATTTTTATITVAAQLSVGNWQISLDNGGSWANCTSDNGNPTVTLTATGLTPGATYSQCKIRGQNAPNDLFEWKQSGTASNAFTITTNGLAGFFMAGAFPGSAFQSGAF